MRNLILSAAISMAAGGLAHADVATFASFEIDGQTAYYVSKMSPDGTYMSGTTADGLTSFRYNLKTGDAEFFPWYYVHNIDNSGTLSGFIFPEGGTPLDPNKLGAYVPLGSAPVPITNPLLENSAAYGTSDDGTVVGLSTNNSGTQGIGSAYVWHATTGMKKLPVNRPTKYSRANGISTDGHLIFGWNDETYGFRTGVIWIDGMPRDIGVSSTQPYGEANGISANDQFIVGSNASDPNNINAVGGWRWNRADNSILFIPHLNYSFGVSNDGKTIVGNASRTDFVDPDYNLSTALIWREGIGTMRLVDWIAENGGTVPETWNQDLPGSVLNLNSDATYIAGWTQGGESLSYTVNVTPDKMFSEGFDTEAGLGVFATLSPSRILAQSAQGAPATLTIAIDNPGQTDATLTSDFVNEFPNGLIVAATPNAMNTCSSAPLAAFPGYDYVALLSGAVIPAGKHCLISVAVTSNNSGTYQNVIPAGSLQTDAGRNLSNSFTTVTVLAGGNGIKRSGTINHTMVDSSSGTTVNWVLGTFREPGTTAGDWDLNLRNTTTMTFRTVATNFNGLAVDTSNAVRILQPGDVVGPSTYFTYAATASAFITTPAWLAGTDGYIGFRFRCDAPRQANPVAGGFCYGYARLQTTAGATGYPVTLVEYAFDGDGKAITVGQ